jgi:hypothetical protein
MQRALGIRILGAASNAEAARDLLARARAGEFAEDDGGEPEDQQDMGTRVAGTALAVALLSGGGFWGSSLPRRIRPVAWQGMLLSGILLLVIVGGGWLIAQFLFNPPRG